MESMTRSHQGLARDLLLKSRAAWIVLLALALVGNTAVAADNPLLECSAIVNPTERLACYDRLAGANKPPADNHPAAAGPPPAALPTAAPSTPGIPLVMSEPSPMSHLWELEEGTRNDLFTLQPYQLTYVLPLKYTDEINQTPFRGQFHGENGTSAQLQREEVKFQVSGKMKVADDLFWDDAALWLAYTQESHWQAYNHTISAPFRETDYEPEAFVVFPTQLQLLGFNARFVSIGAVHQSNGESDPLSRSWNRIYADFGLERGNFSLMLKPWWRIPESASTDDNPDITKYIGRGELQGIYRFDKSLVSVTLRDNFRADNHGSMRIDYVFPIYKKLNGYVQFFSGYGESLIDYNFRQDTIGIGFSVGDGI
jgi:phospholipase A1